MLPYVLSLTRILMYLRYGAFLAAAIFLAAPSDRVNRNLTTAILYATGGGAILLAPWCSNLIALCVVLAFNGGASALLQIGRSEACLIKIRERFVA